MQMRGNLEQKQSHEHLMMVDCLLLFAIVVRQTFVVRQIFVDKIYLESFNDCLRQNILTRDNTRLENGDNNCLET